MEYTTPTEKQSREAIYALSEAERILSSPNPSYQELSLHQAVLTAETSGLHLLRMQPQQRRRLETVLEGIGRIAPKTSKTVRVPVVVSSPYKSRELESKMPNDEGRLTSLDFYSNLEWEAKVTRVENNPKRGKMTYCFRENIQKQNEAGFGRNPFPREVFTLLADGLEGKLKGYLQDVYDDMLSSEGEWLDVAVGRQGDFLFACTFPGEIHGGLLYTCGQKFFIGGLPSFKWIDLNRFNNEFIEWFYGRHFDNLPKEMRKGRTRARVQLPGEGGMSCLSRFSGKYNFSIITGYYEGYASRGVREPGAAKQEVVSEMSNTVPAGFRK